MQEGARIGPSRTESEERNGRVGRSGETGHILDPRATPSEVVRFDTEQLPKREKETLKRGESR